MRAFCPEGSRTRRWPLLVACILLFTILPAGPRAAQVPLSLWTNPSFPDGLDIGFTMGVSWGDYDADGWVDIFACYSGSLWRNVNGTTWQFSENLADSVLPPSERRYGGHFGDYDRDGLPDIATSPRTPAFGDDRLHLLRNLGSGPNFADIAGDPSLVDVQPFGNAETLCWADIDGDRRLDLFVPVYPGGLGPGNFFLHNAGPTFPGGPVGFQEQAEGAGLDNVAGNARPEGAQFVDYDHDGDVDLFSNGAIYQNGSNFGTPKFFAIAPTVSGISLTTLDEGAMLFDYDMDGDQDVVIVYTNEGVKIWESRGDGTFFEAEPWIVDSPMTGLNLGMSAEDWDNDGDVDFTSREVFRQNMLVEFGDRHFIVEPHTIPSQDLTSATPAWADWDRDGDLDCALGNWGSIGRLYGNTLYGPGTPAAQKRHLRLRIVGNSPTVARGLETEYGATAEVTLRNPIDGFRRRKFIASGHGYLNQNEYTLQFGLPTDPAPSDPGDDVRFDVSVDFPDLAGSGLWRVDRHVNPVLANLDLADLTNREMTVYRCGEVVINGVTHAPTPSAARSLTTSSFGLVLPDAGTTPLPDPVVSPQDQWYTGIAFETSGDFGPLRLEEILLDGELDGAASCGSPATIAIWDVTNPGSPTLVPGSAILTATSSRNRRSYFPADVVLAPNRSYRLVARVTHFRPTTITTPLVQGPVRVAGGLSFRDTSPCAGTAVAQAAIDGTKTSIAFRFRPAGVFTDPVGPTLRLGRGFRGAPVLKWKGIPATQYQVLRCSAVNGPCTPTPVGTGTESAFVDGNAVGPPRENYWYLVKGVDECVPGP